MADIPSSVTSDFGFSAALSYAGASLSP